MNMRAEATSTIKTVDIRPGVSVLSILRHLNYKPWFALGEFVDNALQSFLTYREALLAQGGPGAKLRVSIDIESAPGRITIRDNAAGIERGSYARAFRPAAIPPDRSGLSEFGMGMKSAACWFSPRWMVRTSALGEPVERTVRFDIGKIVHDDISEFRIEESSVADGAHFTEVVLQDLHRSPVGRTIGKIKEHLTDIYRVFIRDGLLELHFNSEILRYEEPRILVGPYFRATDEPPRRWKREIDFDLGASMRVSGFAAIREVGSTSRAGFALFRRGRLIQGSGDEGYRPSYIFGGSNSYRYQRLFGELHLEGFEVTHTKDGFRWDENEQPFLELLKEHLDPDELPLLRQAEGHRVRASRDQLVDAARTAVDETARALEEGLEPVLTELEASPEAPDPPAQLPQSSAELASRLLAVRFKDQNWEIQIELTNDPAQGDWLCVSDGPRPAVPQDPRRIGLRVSLAHPFMVQFAGSDAGSIEALLRLAAAIGLAEIVAREAGIRLAGTFRRNINEIVREALSRP
jgi:hypothetical protein